MKITFLILLSLVLVPLARTAASELTIESLPDSRATYRLAPYIDMAAEIQKLDKKAAVAILRRFAASPANSDRVIVLCRMLFTSRAGSTFRRPGIGGAQFLGCTGYADWPLEPIEIVHNVPFLMVRGYILAGEAEPASRYLDYCLANCDWTATRYTPKTPQQLEEALHELLTSKKWKHPLKKDETAFLSSQIK